MAGDTVRSVNLVADEFIVGITGLPGFDIGVYCVVNFLMYSSRGPVHETDERIYGIIKNHPNMIRPALVRLVQAKKLHRSEDGYLFKGRVGKELEKAAARMAKASEKGAKGGRPKKVKGKTGPTQGRDAPDTQGRQAGDATETRGRRKGKSGEKQQVKKTSAFSDEKLSLSQSLSLKDSPNGESPAAGAAMDPGAKELKDRIWSDGVPWLAKRLPNMGKRQIQKIVGKWCSEKGDHAVYEAFRAAFRNSPAEPISYIGKILGTTNGKPPAATVSDHLAALDRLTGFGDMGPDEPAGADEAGTIDADFRVVEDAEARAAGGVPQSHHGADELGDGARDRVGTGGASEGLSRDRGATPGGPDAEGHRVDHPKPPVLEDADAGGHHQHGRGGAGKPATPDRPRQGGDGPRAGDQNPAKGEHRTGTGGGNLAPDAGEVRNGADLRAASREHVEQLKATVRRATGATLRTAAELDDARRNQGVGRKGTDGGKA